MTTTAADYGWFEESFPDLAECYCFTLVRHVTPGGLLRRLGGRPEEDRTGVNAVCAAALNLERRTGRRRRLVALTNVGAWTLMIEPSNDGGVTETTAIKASAGTQWVSHFADVNDQAGFLWAQDGDRRLSFDSSFPDERIGTHPDELLPVMGAVGFPFGGESADRSGVIVAAFALAEHVTGVLLRPDLLRGTTFTCGSIDPAG